MTLELIEKLPVLCINGGKYLIDTGCPVSFSSIDRLEFDGKTYDLPESFEYFTVEKLREGIGDDLVGLIGMDILAEKPFILDYNNLRFELEPKSDTPPKLEVELLPPFNIPRLRIDLMLKSEKIHAAVDTGAPISYMSSRFAENLPVIGVRDDYNPMIGCFKAKVYEVKWGIAGHEFEDEFGVLPNGYERGFQAEGLDCVIGYNLFKRFALEIDVKNKKINMR